MQNTSAIKIKDFFFDTLFQGEGQSFLVDMRQLILNGELVSVHYFQSQIERLLELGQNQLTVIDPTASPNFEGLLSKLVSDSVGYIEIFARTATFPGNKKTLSVNIYLSTGVVNIETQWAAQNAREARYLISTLLVPLYQYGYVNRTYLLWNDEGLVPLVLEQQPCFSNQIKDVLTLAGHPYFTTHEDESALEKYTKDLKNAHLISEQK